MHDFYKTLFKEKLTISEESIQSIVDEVSLPKLIDNQALECENELLKALTSMDNDKTLLQKSFM